MKIIPIAASVAMVASQALAGSVAPVEVVEAEVIDDSTPMGGGSSAWVLPILLIGAIALIVSSVFPVGDEYVSIDIETGDIVGRGFQPSLEITRQGGA